MAVTPAHSEGGAVSRCSASLLVVPGLALSWSRVCWHFHIEGVGMYSIKASNDNTSQPQELEVHLEIGRTLLPKKLVGLDLEALVGHNLR